MSLASRYFNALGLAVMVVCKSVKEAPLEPLVKDSIKLLPCKFRFLFVLKTLSSEEVMAPTP